MNTLSGLRRFASIMQACWLEKRAGLAAVFGIPILYAACTRVGALRSGREDFVNGLGYFGFGLSLLLTLTLSGFTETDRKERRSGFPGRMFTLPVSSGVLAGAPMAFGALVIAFLYVIWAVIAFPLGTFPLTWPIPYLCAALACFQATLWTLARRRVLRLMALGYGGAVFAMAWMAFRSGPDVAPQLSFDLTEATREALTWGLVGLTGVAFVASWLVIEAQRSGGIRWTHALQHRGGRRGSAIATDVTLAQPVKKSDFCRAAFRTPAAAQFWLEWRRHGMVLPLAIAGILLLIVAPAPFVAPVSSGAAFLAAIWMLATPLLISFVLGKGLGKADLWGSDMAIPLFIATKPISPEVRISAKLRMAAASSVLAWALIALVLPLWLWLWCDYEMLAQAWSALRHTYSFGELFGACATLLIAAILLTFRFLFGSIYIGLSGRRWAMNLAACAVFLALFGGLAVILVLSQRRDPLKLIEPAPWLTWTLTGLFALKLCAAWQVTTRAIRAQCLSRRYAQRYGWFWLVSTGFLLAPLWLLAPTIDGWKWLITAAALFVVPLFRTALAPIAIGYSLRR